MSVECSRQLAVKGFAFNRAEFQSGQGAQKEALPVVNCAKKKLPNVTLKKASSGTASVLSQAG